MRPSQVEELSEVDLEEPIPGYFVRGSDAKEARRRLKRDAVEMIARLMPEVALVRDEEVEVKLGGVVLDEDRLRGALELARRLGQASRVGPYR